MPVFLLYFARFNQLSHAQEWKFILIPFAKSKFCTIFDFVESTLVRQKKNDFFCFVLTYSYLCSGMAKNLYIISGCNGAGKTTASYTVLPEILDCREFVNADEIARGYTVRLLFFWLNSPELALQRIAERVAKGGHNIPEPIARKAIRGRHQQSLQVVYGRSWLLGDIWQ